MGWAWGCGGSNKIIKASISYFASNVASARKEFVCLVNMAILVSIRYPGYLFIEIIARIIDLLKVIVKYFLFF